MDSITQAALGAAIGEVMLGKKVGNKGAVLGAIVATIPDLDVILYLFYDKFEMLSIHRGFSHSIAFSILGAFLIAFLLSRIKYFRQITFTTLLLFCWLCLFTHMMLDTFTAYGTQLLLPFSDARVGFDSINVVDPVYTIPLIIGLILSLFIFRYKQHRSTYTAYGLLISTLYLGCTLVNKERVTDRIADQLSKENIQYEALMTMPVGIANVHWYVVAKGRDTIYMMKHSILDNKDHPIESFSINDHYLNEIDSQVAEKMRWFSKGFYTVQKIGEKVRIFNLQVDMRGIVQDGKEKAPTVGYFEVSHGGDKTSFSSGSVKSNE